MKKRIIWNCIILSVGLSSCIAISASAQVDVRDAANPGVMKSRVTLDIESYFFFQNAQFYAARFGYLYALPNERHLFGLAVPFVHNIFDADYQGFENTTGMGDIEMLYMMNIPLPEKASGFQSLSPYFEVTAPTGEYRAGRGAGSWMYKPGLLFSIILSPEVILFPEIKFQFSNGQANTLGGIDGLPDPNGFDRNSKVQNFTVQLPAVLLLDEWQGWLSINAQYIRSFYERTDFIFLRTDFGKMITEKTSAALTISKFVAGQPRLNVTVQAKLQFFLNK